MNHFAWRGLARLGYDPHEVYPLPLPTVFMGYVEHYCPILPPRSWTDRAQRLADVALTWRP